MTGFPSSIVNGSKIVWRESRVWEDIPIADRTGSIDPAAWDLAYRIAGTTTALWTSTANGGEWLFILEKATTALLPPGDYWAQFQLTDRADASNQFLGDRISLKVEENFGAISSPADFRTSAEKELSQIEAAISAILEGKAASYSLAGRSVTALDLTALYNRQARIKARIDREKNQRFFNSSLIKFNPPQ
jgi:hypothetical protein